MRNSQVSLFLSFVLLLLLVGFVVSLLHDPGKSFKSQTQKESADSVTFFVNSCLDVALKNSLRIIGSQGGYYVLQENTLSQGNLSVPLYFENDTIRLPSLEKVESELSQSIEDQMKNCLDNFSEQKEKGIDIQAGSLQVQSTIGKNTVNAKLTYPLSISMGKTTARIEHFQIDFDFDFLSKYETIREFEAKQTEMSNYIPISHLSSLAVQRGFTFDLLEVGDGTIIYFFIFNESIQNKPFVFIFANRYA